MYNIVIINDEDDITINDEGGHMSPDQKNMSILCSTGFYDPEYDKWFTKRLSTTYIIFLHSEIEIRQTRR